MKQRAFIYVYPQWYWAGGTSSDPLLSKNFIALTRITVGKNNLSYGLPSMVTSEGVLLVFSIGGKTELSWGYSLFSWRNLQLPNGLWVLKGQSTKGGNSQGPKHLGSVDKVRTSPLLTPPNKNEAHWKLQSQSVCSLHNDSVSGRRKLMLMLWQKRKVGTEYTAQNNAELGIKSHSFSGVVLWGTVVLTHQILKPAPKSYET